MTSTPDSSGHYKKTPPDADGFNMRDYLVPFMVAMLVTIFLWLVGLYNFALYHTTVEFITVAISVAIFLLIWKSRRIIDNNYLLFIGITFIFIAALDFLHTLVYQGVGIFPDGGGTLSTRFWIAARYMQAVTLLAAPLFIRRTIRLDLVMIVYLAADILIVSSILIFHNFPSTYIPASGLTPFKIISEYIISLLLIASVVLLYRNRSSFDRHVLNNLVIAITLTIAAELTFTEYASFTDIFSLLGHVFRLVSYYFFYRAIIEVGQEKPYNLLYHNLTESEKKYRALSDLSPDAIMVVQDGIIMYANEAGLRMSGISRMEELLGREQTDFVHPDDRASAATRISAILEGQVVAPLRELKMLSGEKTIIAEATGGPILWEGKKAVQIIIRNITERKRFDESLQESEERFRTIAETVPVLVCITRLEDGIVQFTNEYNNKAFGLRGEDIVGSKGPDYYCDPADRLAMLAMFRERGSVDNYPLKVKKSNGTPFWILTSVRPITFQGHPAIIGASIDITQQKEAEGALRETTQYLDNLINHANAPIIVWDRQFQITRFNHAFELLTGVAADEAIGQHLSIVFPKEFRDDAMDIVERTMRGERLNVVELPILHKNGRVSVVLWNSATLYESDGTTVSSTIAQGQDITERKMTEEALRESEALAREHSEDLALLIEAVPAAVWIAHDPKALHITGNALSDDWLRIPHGSESSKSAPEGIRPETFRLFKSGRELQPDEMPVQRSAGGEIIRNYEFDFVYPDGTKRTVLGNSTPLRDADEKPRGSVSSFIDITERKLAEEELKRRHDALSEAFEKITATQEELHQNVEELSLREQELLQSEANLKDALTEKEILLSEIHHRVKNNLAAFISLLSLDGTYEDTETGRALKKDLQNRARSMALIHETLYRTGKFSNVEMETYLTTLVSQIAGSYAGSGTIRTVVEARGASLDLARATTTGLIINELVTNSFKYAFPAGFNCLAVRGEPCTIRVSLVEDDGTYVLSVGDNGRGLPAGLDPLATKSLGLKLVNFLARHQLRADIAVLETKGTEFIFRLHKTEDPT
jgi:PAS domain S-box-containing protein